MFAAALLTFLRRYDIICALLILARCARLGGCDSRCFFCAGVALARVRYMMVFWRNL